jgi:hypothetical protein
MSNRRATKRRRHHHHQHHGYNASTSNEERLLHQAIQNSKLGDSAHRGTRNGAKIDVPWGPVFFPTVEDMEGSPLDYIDKIRPIAQKYGICKIVPPEGWKQTDFFGEYSTAGFICFRFYRFVLCVVAYVPGKRSSLYAATSLFIASWDLPRCSARNKEIASFMPVLLSYALYDVKLD